jgi:hypothetical protein
MQLQAKQTARDIEFRLGDILPAHWPDILRRMTGELELRGTVMDIVKLGEPPELYAMIEVEGVETPMLVPISALQR